MSKPSSPSNADWLGPSLLAAKAITAAAETAPVPFVKGVFGTILVILETIQKVRKNQDSLKELCGKIMEIMKVLQGFDQASDTMKFGILCEDLQSTLCGILGALNKMQNKPSGIRGRLKEVMYSGDVSDELSGYQNKIQELQFSFMFITNLDIHREVHKIGTILENGIQADSALVQGNQEFNNCPPASRIFHGRDAILENMRKYFMQDSESQHIYVLYGLGGVGKTQTALRFIQQSCSWFSSTWLIDASTENTIDAGLKNIAMKKKIGVTAEEAKQWFTAKNEEWLLFFDNADDPEIDLNKYFPQCGHGNILITTRNPGLCVYSEANTCVDNMVEDDAIVLLFKSAGLQSTLKNRAPATAIVKELGYLPLAIIQAGAFIAKSRDLESYLSVYSMNKTRLLSEKPVQSHDSYKWTVYTTWQMSFKKLSPLAARLLQLCSLLSYNGILEDFFTKASKYESKSTIPPREDLKDSLEFLSRFMLSGGTWNSLQFQDVTAEIMAYSLMEFRTDKRAFSMHPLVHDWCQSTIPEQEAYRSCMIGILGMCISCIPAHDLGLESLKYVSHLDILLYAQTQIVPDFRVQYAHMYQAAGQYPKAERLRTLALEKHRQLLGDDHPDTLRAMSHLVETYISLGRFNDGKMLGVLALQKQKQILEDDHPETLKLMANLGHTYFRLGQFEEALKINVPALEKQRQILEKNHPDISYSMAVLADTYIGLGQYKDALELYILVVEQYRQAYGDDHPVTLVSMTDLASTYYYLGQYEKAVSICMLVLERKNQILGEDHPHTMMAMANLASAYNNLGQYQEACSLGISVFERRKQILGEDHPQTMISMANLAATYNGLGQDEEALKLEIHIFQKRRQISGEDHPDTLVSMANLAFTYKCLGKYEEALRLEVPVLQKRRQVIGEDHPWTLVSMVNLAVTYKHLGKFEEALRLETSVLQKRGQILGQDHPDTLRTMTYMAITFGQLNKFEEAKELQVSVLEKHQQIAGDNHPDTLRAMVFLGATYYNLGNVEEANKLAIPAQEKLIGDRNRDTLRAMSSLAAAYRNTGNIQGAEELDTLFQQTQTLF